MCLKRSLANISKASSAGFTLVELLMVVAILSILMLAIIGLLDSSLKGATYASDRNELTQEARFALQRMSRSINRSNQLVLPLADNPLTSQLENIRDPGVLAVVMDAGMDRDSDGFADADNDKDGLIDEDGGEDSNNDSEPGIAGIDDDGDGNIDEGNDADDDEDGSVNEDFLNGIDDDDDGSIDEDSGKDANNDSGPGIAEIDDDGDGNIDEGNDEDDDEDGSVDEDWLDTVVYYLNAGQLIERMPDLNPADGTEYSEHSIADNVTSFRVERLVQGKNRYQLVDLSLQLTNPESGESITLQTQVRVGGAL